jgi:hypothetical protein
LPQYERQHSKQQGVAMVKTATFEALLEGARPDDKGGFIFTLEGKTYHITDKDEVRKIAEQHGYIIIY